jgi:superfamily I DNA/RNA helicase/RecB family exonuclease
VLSAAHATVADTTDLVSHTGGPLLLEGPAGSGKTEFIFARYRWLVEQGTMPERIALLVPSPAHAAAAQIRLEQQLHDGYGEVVAVTPSGLAAVILRRAGRRLDLLDTVIGPGDRLAMLAERIDQLPLQNHDFGGNKVALLGGLIRLIDRLKAELIDADEYAEWAATLADDDGPREREFAEIFRIHDRMLRQAGGCDHGDLMREALRMLRDQPGRRRPFEHVLIDDVQELDLAAVTLARTVAFGALTAAGDPLAAVRRFRGAGDARMRSLASEGSRVVSLTGSFRCPEPIMRAAWTVGLGTAPASDPAPAPASDPAPAASDPAPAVSNPKPPVSPPASVPVEFWRAANERAQAQSVAAEIERVLSNDPAATVAVVVPSAAREGQAVSVALEERAVAHQLIGDAAFFQRVEIRDLLAWLRLLADPNDAPAVVRALARSPIELRSVDIARCTQIARRRKIDMVAALAAATESPQVPPEARERIRNFLKLYRAASAQIDTMRADLYVHRLIERLGLRRQQLFAAQTDVVERLRALARFGELASAHVSRMPQGTAREFARSIAAVAENGLREQAEPDLAGAVPVQVLELSAVGGLEVDHVFLVGLRSGLERELRAEPVPDALLRERLPAEDEQNRRAWMRQRLYVAVSRARKRTIFCYPATIGERATKSVAEEVVETARNTLQAQWLDCAEELFGPDEALQSTYRLLRDELLEGTMRAGGRLGELRFDTDLDVSHAVVRYLELLKVAALLASVGDGTQGVTEALRDVNTRIAGAVTSEQREIFQSSPLDDYLLDAERDVKRRARVIAARDEPSLERFLPMRGDGVLLSASDIDTYRSCPLKYKFARVFRIPQEPTLHQRFGIAVHHVLERYHGAAVESGGQPGSLAELLGLLDEAWRRQGFGDSDEERQLRGKAAAALARYHEHSLIDQARPVWFERQFTFKLGPHVLRGRVDRVDRTPNGEYELIDYKTGRPKSADELADDVQLALYAVAARESWGLEASRGAYYYLLDDVKVAVSGDEQWIRDVATEVAEGIRAQEFEPTPSARACSLCDYRLACPAAER